MQKKKIDFTEAVQGRALYNVNIAVEGIFRLDDGEFFFGFIIERHNFISFLDIFRNRDYITINKKIFGKFDL